LDSIIANLRAIVGRDNVLSQPDELLVYECDGLPQHKHLPRAVVFPSSTEETAAVMRELARARVPFTPRGAGTGLSGGALALNQGVVIELARMRKVLKIDEENRLAVVQTGVVNLQVSRAVAHLGLHYVPDPSSQPTCTIGGNIAENAGGIHCLKYGTTTDHVLGARVVLAGGDVIDLGGAGTERFGYDLLGTFIGSEGTFGIATEATLRLVPIPPAVRTLLAEFDDVDNASHAVSAIIAAGVMPAALEMMDREIIRAVEASVFAAGLSLDIAAALLIELDGLEAGIDDEAEQVRAICLDYGARSCRSAEDEAERKRLWAARKSAFGAISRISPDSMIQDAVVPRSRLPEVLADAYRISAKYQLRLANVFHAGDGNLHPLICFDSRFPEQVQSVKEAGRELMEACVRAGGSITGEHGVGLDKRELLSLVFSAADMDTMLRVRAAFDPTGLCNPGKIIPMLRGCGEARAVSPTTQAAPEARDLRAVAPVTQATTLEAGDSLGARASRPQLQFDPDLASQRLGQIVGVTNISAAPGVTLSQLTVTPESIEQLCEVMKLASSEGWTVVPSGAGTWMDVANRIERADVIVSTRKLNRMIEHEPADLIAITEAGVTLEDFNNELSIHGQWLPLDPPDDGRATIGGVVATGVAGAHQLGYGPPRRHVIGMKIVLADGTLIKVGGRVVKNVAGYDLCKLFTGSYGTLGVIVEVNFKLRPIPFETKTILAWGERDDLLEGARRVIDARLFPVAVELVSPRFAVEPELAEGKHHLLLIRFAGLLTAVTHQLRVAGALLEDGDMTRPAPLVSDDAKLWRDLAAVPLRFPQELACRVGVRPADVPGYLKKLDEKDSASEFIWQAGVADGRIRLIDQAIDQTRRTADESITLVQLLRAEAETLGGALMVENASTEIKSRVDAFGSFGDSAALMARIKRQLDPKQIYSPGRLE
jgi:glycolate oxidase subunit GlcD